MLCVALSETRMLLWWSTAMCCGHCRLTYCGGVINFWKVPSDLKKAILLEPLFVMTISSSKLVAIPYGSVRCWDGGKLRRKSPWEEKTLISFAPGSETRISPLLTWVVSHGLTSFPEPNSVFKLAHSVEDFDGLASIVCNDEVVVFGDGQTCWLALGKGLGVGFQGETRHESCPVIDGWCSNKALVSRCRYQWCHLVSGGEITGRNGSDWQHPGTWQNVKLTL